MAKENVALYNRHKGQDQDQAKWHAMQAKELEDQKVGKSAAKPAKVEIKIGSFVSRAI